MKHCVYCTLTTFSIKSGPRSISLVVFHTKKLCRAELIRLKLDFIFKKQKSLLEPPSGRLRDRHNVRTPSITPFGQKRDRFILQLRPTIPRNKESKEGIYKHSLQPVASVLPLFFMQLISNELISRKKIATINQTPK